jgi:hypothetical protein
VWGLVVFIQETQFGQNNLIQLQRFSVCNRV